MGFQDIIIHTSKSKSSKKDKSLEPLIQIKVIHNTTTDSMASIFCITKGLFLLMKDTKEMKEMMSKGNLFFRYQFNPDNKMVRLIALPERDPQSVKMVSSAHHLGCTKFMRQIGIDTENLNCQSLYCKAKVNKNFIVFKLPDVKGSKFITEEN